MVCAYIKNGIVDLEVCNVTLEIEKYVVNKSEDEADNNEDNDKEEDLESCNSENNGDDSRDNDVCVRDVKQPNKERRQSNC